MTLDALPATSITKEISSEARLRHDGWVSEFEAFQWPAGKGSEGSPHTSSSVGPTCARPGPAGRMGGARGVSSTAGTGDPSTAMDNLRAEIKLLHWHKLANEAALKAALLKTKKIKAHGGGSSRLVPATSTLSMPREQRAAWMQQVIEEEQSKPLQVSKDFMQKYEEQEENIEGRLDTEVAAHIRSLRNLREQIEERGDAKARRVTYRAAQKELELDKQQLLLGKLHATGTYATTSARMDTQEGPGARPWLEARCKPGQRQLAPEKAGTINTVLGSLDKLVQLERRISSLEKSNVYDDFRATTKGAAASDTDHVPRSVERHKVRARGCEGSRRRSSVGRQTGGPKSRRLSFSKNTTEATIGKPGFRSYSVRVRRKPGLATGGSAPLRRRSRGVMHNDRRSGEQNLRVGMSTSPATGCVSTFLTQLPDVHRHPKPAKGRQTGGGSVRTAIREKKHLEAKRKVAAHRAEAVRIARQDRIICEWMNRAKKAAEAIEVRSGSLSSVRRPGGVPAAGRQRRRSTATKNVHLQEFRDIRARYAKRTDILRRDLSRGLQGPEGRALAGTKTIAVACQRAPVASYSSRSRPGKSLCTFSNLQRGTRAGVSRSLGHKARRSHARTSEGMRGSDRRAGQGLVVGGTGLRAARA
ncbi:unnamed protein product, partial [Scytosiphon promiscuus]